MKKTNLHLIYFYSLGLVFLGSVIFIICLNTKKEGDVVFNEPIFSEEIYQSYQKKYKDESIVKTGEFFIQEVDEDTAERLKSEVVEDLNNSVDFWGKVVDEKGEPVQGATAEIAITDKFSWTPNAKNTTTKYNKQSDEKGLFSLLGKKGGSVRVRVTADGYSPSYDKKLGRDMSRLSMSYVGENDKINFQRPAEDSPTVFVLRKKSAVDELFVDAKKNVKISKEGEAEIITFKNKEGREVGFKIQCWSDSPDPFNYDSYDWRAKIEVVNGRLQPVTQRDPVMAPEKGYSDSYTMDMIQGKNKIWKRSSPGESRNFWVQFDDKTYAKARIKVKTGRKHEVDAEIWYNLDGTRNFEGWDENP